jgi:hypothetical protein
MSLHFSKSFEISVMYSSFILVLLPYGRVNLITHRGTDVPQKDYIILKYRKQSESVGSFSIFRSGVRMPVAKLTTLTPGMIGLSYLDLAYHFKSIFSTLS